MSVKSGQRDFLLSMQEPGTIVKNSSRNIHDDSQSDVSTEHLSFMSSVVVVPKPSGDGYDVYRSTASIRRESSVLEDYLDLSPTSATPIFSAFKQQVEKKKSKAVVNTPSKTQLKATDSKGFKFSMNILNPAMQKKSQSKLHDAKKMFLTFRSTGGKKGENYSPAKNDEPNSKPLTPIPLNVSLNVDKCSAPSSASNIFEAAQTKETTTKPDSVSPQVGSHLDCANATRSVVVKGVSPALQRYEECGFHNSMNSIHEEPHRDNTSGKEPLGTGSNRARTTSALLRPGDSFRQPEPGVLSNVWRKVSRKSAVKNEPENHRYPFRSNSSSGYASHSRQDFECSCKGYHSHCFSGETMNSDIEIRKERRAEMITSSTKPEQEQWAESVDHPRNVFWIPSLSFHPYKHGDKTVAYSTLWPKYKELRDLLQNAGVQQLFLNANAVLDICTLACTCGPAHLLQCLVELRLIRIDQLLENGSGLLHLALLAHNVESAQYLMAAKISPKIRDNKGLTADQLCFNTAVRKQMAPRYILNRDISKDRILLKPSLQEKDSIFRLAANPENFVEIQKKLQTLDFNVNTECDNNGDFLLHLAVCKGLNQLPLLMALVEIQKADIELCNADGMTALMLAAAAGNDNLCDVLICLFGANPNKPNSQTGKSALHYAAERNHRKTVECLIRRGADINMEDHDGLRADDLPTCSAATDDCRDIIMFNRRRRLEMLSDLVKKGEVVSSQLFPSDMCVVDSDENTLIMTAAIYNRYRTLHCLLDINQSTINAQHSKTGMTALAISAKMGNVEAVSMLLRHKACPSIADMAGYLPLHHAVMNSHENVVDIFLEHFPDTYMSLYKAMRLCKKTSLHTKLRAAWERRQEEIVRPKLLGSALNGDAGELFLMLEEGDNVNPKSGTANWPTYLAVENDNLDVLKLLCERGSDIRQRHPTTGATVLHVAAKMGHQNIVSYLLQYCKNCPDSAVQATSQEALQSSGQSHGKRKRFLDINAVDKDNKTALQLAAEHGYSRIVGLLLSHGATTALLDSDGNLVTCPQYEGVRIMIEAQRQLHTHQVMKAIEDKSKKSLPSLQQIWLPKFDHHLRNKDGNTPLMIAAETGKVAVIQFLLESAVYLIKEVNESDSCDSDSDADSGVLERTSDSPKASSRHEDEFQASLEGEPITITVAKDLSNNLKQDYLNSALQEHRGSLDSSDFYQRNITRIVSDANRPKGQSIYQYGVVSHVCAVNLTDSTNVLHHTVLKADAPHILNLFLDHDPAPLNMQDDRGETVLHTACRLRRKKCVELILAHPDIDLNIRTFDGHLPEEVTSSKAILKMVEKARASAGGLSDQNAQLMQRGMSVCDSDKTASITASTVNFDKIHSQYETLKKNGIRGFAGPS